MIPPSLLTLKAKLIAFAVVVIVVGGYIFILNMRVANLKLEVSQQQNQINALAIRLEQQNDAVVMHRDKSHALQTKVNNLLKDLAGKDAALRVRLENFQSEPRPIDATCTEAVVEVRELFGE